MDRHTLASAWALSPEDRRAYLTAIEKSEAKAKAAKTDFYLVVADGSVDQIAQGLSCANREKRDLESMGFSVSLIGPLTGRVVDEIQTMAEEGSSPAACRAYAKRFA